MESSHFYKVKLRSIDHLRGYQQRSLGKICKEAKVLIQFPDFEDSVGDTVLIITGGISAVQKAIGLINRHLEQGNFPMATPVEQPVKTKSLKTYWTVKPEDANHIVAYHGRFLKKVENTSKAVVDFKGSTPNYLEVEGKQVFSIIGDDLAVSCAVSMINNKLESVKCSPIEPTNVVEYSSPSALSYSADNSKNSDSEEGEDRTVMNGMIETITQDLSLHLQIPTIRNSNSSTVVATNVVSNNQDTSGSSGYADISATDSDGDLYQASTPHSNSLEVSPSDPENVSHSETSLLDYSDSTSDVQSNSTPTHLSLNSDTPLDFSLKPFVNPVTHLTEAPNDLAEVEATNDQVHFVDAETMELIEQKLSDIDKQVENVRQILKNLPRS